MNLIALPAFTDNYVWLLHDDRHVLAVDPGECTVVQTWLSQHPNLQLDAILVTHHHADHTGGLTELVAQTGAQVWGPALEKLPVPAQGVQQGDIINWHGLQWHVLDVPGHTLGHVAYWSQPTGQLPILLCGDTLFSAGCGRLFEGTPAQMLDSLDRLSSLPDSTRICCAHEYTLSNLQFAVAVEPFNAAIITHRQACIRLRQQGLATLPGNLATERTINPFLRTRHADVRAAVRQIDPHALDDVSVFTALRQWKNTFQ